MVTLMTMMKMMTVDGNGVNDDKDKHCDDDDNGW